MKDHEKCSQGTHIWPWNILRPAGLFCECGEYCQWSDDKYPLIAGMVKCSPYVPRPEA